MKTSLFLFFLIECVKCAFKPTTKFELQAAVDAWCDKPSSAEITYGPPSTWLTGLVTSMSSLFKDKTACNPAIGSWNTKQVTI